MLGGEMLGRYRVVGTLSAFLTEWNNTCFSVWPQPPQPPGSRSTPAQKPGEIFSVLPLST